MKKVDFGFGTMRMPVLEKEDPTSFDYEKMEALVDAFIEKGFTYFDTAYTYHGYHAEEAVKQVLTDRYPRDRFRLATKLPLRDFKDADDMEAIFNEQLTHCGVEYFDNYLLHNMGHNVYSKCVKYNAFGFVARKKAEGKIRQAGMSFHDTPELLEEILEKYGEILDFVQLQINYADMDQPNVQGRRCLEIAEKFGKPVYVMEPCKGGTLINLPEAVSELLKSSAPERSAAYWALRFAASQPGVVCVLSGMNDMAQIEDNCAAFKDFEPLSDEENAVIEKAAEMINANTAVACTGCAYCTHDCPQQINIPAFFAVYNSAMRTTGSFSSQAVYYNNIVQGGSGKASECVKCGQCENACPQHLPIRENLEKVAEKFESGPAYSVRR